MVAFEAQRRLQANRHLVSPVAQARELHDYATTFAREAGVVQNRFTKLEALSRALAIVGVALALSLPLPVMAQSGPGGAVNPNRDCQTIRTCNFSRGGSFRGCISSYSCRVCQLVAQRCNIGNQRSNCRQMRCNWGA